MHRTTINISESVFREVRPKAPREVVTVSEVGPDLLARWVAGGIEPGDRERAREKLVALAVRALGLWADRDPDAMLDASRAGLRDHDEGLTDARLHA